MNCQRFTVRLLQYLLLSVSAFCAEPGMVFIPAGEFSRGRTYDWIDYNLKWSPTAHQDDTPVRKIYVDAFYMDEAEVTNEQYAAFVKSQRHRAPYHWIKGQIPAGKEKHPVVNVSWDDAVTFCTWRNKRLPTEAEWEHACRGVAEGKMFPWGDKPPTAKEAHFTSETTTAVCGKERNYFGLCDMIGNVWEWCSDWYDPDYYKERERVNPKGPARGRKIKMMGFEDETKAMRGGGFGRGQAMLRIAERSSYFSDKSRFDIGFRVVREIERGANSGTGK